MSVHNETRRLTTHDLFRMRANNERIAMLTGYDATFAALLEAAGVDVVLIGDSLGMVLQGHDSTLPVSLDELAYHVACVARGCKRPLILADMPFATFQISPKEAFRNAARLMASGAQMVKIEGGAEMAETVAFLTTRGIPVCGHIGLTPQAVNQLGGYRVQGKDDASAARLKADALAMQDAGASIVLMEAMPAALAGAITASLHVPTIGIGAGAQTTGQVLVLHDMLDLTAGKKPRFVRNFMAGAPSVAAAVEAYVRAVKDGSFPAAEHCYAG
jgi:3-methyl-2-oxobutanoate hydroxymethyltransferase